MAGTKRARIEKLRLANKKAKANLKQALRARFKAEEAVNAAYDKESETRHKLRAEANQ